MNNSMKSFLQYIREAKQEFTSAATSQSQIAKGFKQIGKRGGWKRGTLNVDLGGGRYEHGTKWMSEQGVESYVYDPYNRSTEHNEQVSRLVTKRGGADSVTVFNVLNTIKEPEVHLEVLQSAKKFLKPGGSLWLSVYHGNRKGIGKRTKRDSWQRNEPIHAYLDTVKQVFPNAKIKHGMIHATDV